MGILLALASAFVTAAYLVVTSGTMKSRPAVSPLVTLAAGHLTGGLVLLVLNFSQGVFDHYEATWFVAGALAGTAALLFSSRVMFYFAYARTDVANVTMFSALTPLYAALTGYFFNHERLSAPLLLGIVTISASLFWFFLSTQADLPAGSRAAAVVAPLGRILRSPPLRLALLSTVPPAFAVVLQKQLLTRLSPVEYSVAILFLVGGAALLSACVVVRPRVALAGLRALPISYYVNSAIAVPVMHLLFCYALQREQSAVSLVVQRCSMLLQVLLAHRWLEERTLTRRALAAVGGVLLGMTLIAGFR